MVEVMFFSYYTIFHLLMLLVCLIECFSIPHVVYYQVNFLPVLEIKCKYIFLQTLSLCERKN